MFQDNLKIKNKKLPKFALGTAPFVSLPYFGHRARLYQLDFEENPENIYKIIKYSYDKGVRAIQAIPEKPMINALKIVKEENLDISIYGTIRKDNLNKDIQLFSDLNADIMFLDEWITDKSEPDFIMGALDIINEENTLSGLITTLPKETSKKLINSPIKELFDVYMLPINKLGYLMDYPLFVPSAREELKENLIKLDKPVMATQTLAAGILQPQEALEFIKSLGYIDMITIGLAKTSEVDETIKYLF